MKLLITLILLQCSDDNVAWSNWKWYLPEELYNLLRDTTNAASFWPTNLILSSWHATKMYSIIWIMIYAKTIHCIHETETSRQRWKMLSVQNYSYWPSRELINRNSWLMWWYCVNVVRRLMWWYCVNVVRRLMWWYCINVVRRFMIMNFKIFPYFCWTLQ